MANDDLNDFLAQYHEALGEFVRGNPEPARDLWSARDDITLGNPFGHSSEAWRRSRTL